MERIQKLCVAATLLLVLSLSVLAGEIHTNVIEPPPPPPASATATQPGVTTIHTPQGASKYETLVTEITLSVLRLLSVV